MNEQILSAIRGRLRDRGLDAYIGYTPSNVFPADGSLEVGMMVGDFEARPAQRVSGIRDVQHLRVADLGPQLEWPQEPLGSKEAETPRPAQFDEGEQDEIVRGLLGDRGKREGAHPCATGWRSSSWR